MSKPAVFTMKPEADAPADAEPVGTEREHTAFLRRKVEAARASLAAGQGRSSDDVEADFAARRARIADRA